jgi:5'-3' exonuclease
MGNRPKRNGTKSKSVNTLIIDGNALFKNAFHGAKDLYNKQGHHIGGVYQFLTKLRMLLKSDVYNRVYVFWDGEFSGKNRYIYYSDYKIARGKDYENGTKPQEKSEIVQKYIIRQYLEELCIRQYMDETDFGAEADDMIAYIVNTKSDNEKITICTGDRDICQLIDTDVKLFLLDKKTYVTKDNYNDHFNHALPNLKLIKMIGGDASDSIKGIKGIKEPTLIKHFPKLQKEALELDDIITQAKLIQSERELNKKKRLKNLDNIINCVTEGKQGKDLYKINEIIINLKKPLLNQKIISILAQLKNPIGDLDKRGIKNVYKLMIRDGIDNEISNFSTEYLLPFKKLIDIEIKNCNDYEN